jgi:hypothetical protein
LAGLICPYDANTKTSWRLYCIERSDKGPCVCTLILWTTPGQILATTPPFFFTVMSVFLQAQKTFV